jgi:hypothetical protein
MVTKAATVSKFFTDCCVAIADRHYREAMSAIERGIGQRTVTRERRCYPDFDVG